MPPDQITIKNTRVLYFKNRKGNHIAIEVITSDDQSYLYEYFSDVEKYQLKVEKEGKLVSVGWCDVGCKSKSGVDVQLTRQDYLKKTRKWGKYVEILLPATNPPMDFSVFTSSIENKDYNFYSESKTQAKINYKALTNNCAHVVQDVLIKAGYDYDEPLVNLGLLPHDVAHRAFNVWLMNEEIERAKNFNDRSLTYKTVIFRIINSLCTEIEIQLNANIKNENYYDEYDLLLLKNILKSINKEGIGALTQSLLRACKKTNDDLVGTLQKCLQLLPRTCYLEASILQLEQKAFRTNDTEKSQTLFNLANDLKTSVDQLKINNDYNAFRAESLKSIEQATSILGKHRGYKRILSNIALAVVGLGVFYLAAASINKYRTGHFLFFNDTASLTLAKKVTQEAESLGRCYSHAKKA